MTGISDNRYPSFFHCQDYFYQPKIIYPPPLIHLTMYEEGPLNTIKFSESRLWSTLSIVLALIGTIIAIFTSSYNGPRFLPVPISLLTIILVTAASSIPSLINEHSKVVIYKDRFVYKFTPFKKYDIDFSEVQNIKVIDDQRFKANRLEFEMINVDDVSLNLNYVKKEKFDEIKYAVLYAWRKHKGYVTNTPSASLVRWEDIWE